MPEGGAVYDPTNGYYYSPTALSAVMPVRVTLPDGEARTVYVPYDRSRPVSAVEYRQLVAAAIAYAQAAPADAGGAEETVAPERPAQDEGRRAGPAEPGRRFGSTLSPMLGGGSRVSMLFALGETRLRQGRFGEAVGEFHRNIRSAPNDGASHLALALAFAGVGAYGPAASEARTGLANATDPATLTLDPAAVFGDAGKFDTIRSEVAGALAETPGDADLIVVAGFLAFLGGDYDQAADLLERSRQAGLRDAGVARLLVAAKAMLRAREAAPADAAEPQEGSTEPQ
jgi:Flp pilus assembly protein TadD